MLVLLFCESVVSPDEPLLDPSVSGFPDPRFRRGGVDFDFRFPFFFVGREDRDSDVDARRFFPFFFFFFFFDFPRRCPLLSFDVEGGDLPDLVVWDDLDLRCFFSDL